jgi:hypothetical protein
MEKKKKLQPKDKRIKEVLKNGGREGAKEDFFELLRRAARPLKPKR